MKLSHPACVPHTQPIRLSRAHSRLVPCAISRDASAAAETILPRWKGPAVDWSRYHLQILFVDHSDQLRAKLTAAFFEQASAQCVVQVVRGRINAT